MASARFESSTTLIAHVAGSHHAATSACVQTAHPHREALHRGTHGSGGCAATAPQPRLQGPTLACEVALPAGLRPTGRLPAPQGPLPRDPGLHDARSRRILAEQYPAHRPRAERRAPPRRARVALACTVCGTDRRSPRWPRRTCRRGIRRRRAGQRLVWRPWAHRRVCCLRRCNWRCRMCDLARAGHRLRRRQRRHDLARLHRFGLRSRLRHRLDLRTRRRVLGAFHAQALG